jgi:hypothetical protein
MPNKMSKQVGFRLPEDVKVAFDNALDDYAYIIRKKTQVPIKRSDIIRSFAEHFITIVQNGGVPKWPIQLAMERKTKN